jgi:hypothetical protein
MHQRYDVLSPAPGSEVIMKDEQASLFSADTPDTRIRWVEVAALVGLGHGVEFWHEHIKNGPIAFVVGYGWLHKPGAEPITVRILKSPPQSGELGVDDWNATIRGVKVAVARFLAEPRRFRNQDRIGKVSLWFNA